MLIVLAACVLATTATATFQHLRRLVRVETPGDDDMAGDRRLCKRSTAMAAERYNR
jgi:hypothetical protein